MSEYQIKPVDYQNVHNILAQDFTENWLNLINSNIIVTNNFHSSLKVKTLEELIEELSVMDPSEKEFLHDSCKKVTGLTESRIKKFSKKLIQNWDITDIKQWSRFVKSNNQIDWSREFMVELIAVINRANYMAFNFNINNAQIISSLIALKEDKLNGKLLQVSTGEGKSTIICVLAIAKVLMGNQVDIMTSSPVLAERDAKEKRKLYEYFEISCGCNKDTKVYQRGEKICYRKDIVYGETSQFQFDVLRDEYSGLDTLARRKARIAIVDEVDSMLIDDSSKIARLSTTLSGTDLFQQMYFFIWQRLVAMREKILCIDGKTYFLYGKYYYEDHKLVLEFIQEENGEYKNYKIDDLKLYLKNIENISEIGKIIDIDIEIFIKNNLIEYVQEQVKQKIITYPAHFDKFVKKQISKWVDSALTAFFYQENVHYVIQDGSIKPVDYNNTGIVQDSTSWSDGLHQFLQIKHGLKLTSQTLTTNFLSNIGLFKRYKQLIGLTGTLGSKKSREVLESVYNVGLVDIPQLHNRQFKQITPLISFSTEEWLKNIGLSVKKEVCKKRGVLIICETIEHAYLIENEVKKTNRSSSIKLYTMNNKNQERLIENIEKSEVFIATNLAGRGTNIKTDEIEENGGLHVILTFMPSNQRVEEQALGRTARQGKRGSAQLVLDLSCFIQQQPMNSVEEIKKLRDETETQLLNEFKKKNLDLIETKDRLFSEFCSDLKKIRENLREFLGLLDSVYKLFKKSRLTPLESNIISAIEEDWSMFLSDLDDGLILVDEAESKYKKLINQHKEKFNSEKKISYEDKFFNITSIVKNPFNLIKIANDFIYNDSIFVNKFDKAYKLFEDAIELDPDFSTAAYIGRSWCLLQGKKSFFAESDFFGYKHHDDYKNEAIESYLTAVMLLDNEMGVLNTCLVFLDQFNLKPNCDLYKQLEQKLSILGNYMNSVKCAIQVVKKSLRLIDIRCKKKNAEKAQIEDTFFDIQKLNGIYLVRFFYSFRLKK